MAETLRLEERVEVDPTRTALIIGDMQNDFVNPKGKLFVKEAPKTVEPCRRLLHFAREHSIIVIFIQDTHRPGDPEWSVWGEHVHEGSWGWEIISELAPRDDELRICKPRYDAFYGTTLDHELRRRGIETLIICGTVANICVQYTAASAGLRWYKVILPVDAISGFTEAEKREALRQLNWLFQARLTRVGNFVANKRAEVETLAASRSARAGRGNQK
jgi:nicotinamidase-related amidase